MAALNVKNFPEDLHRKLRARAQADRRSVAQEVIHILSAHLEGTEPLSVMHLKGLGRAHWAGVDPAHHVSQERDSWD